MTVKAFFHIHQISLQPIAVENVIYNQTIASLRFQGCGIFFQKYRHDSFLFEGYNGLQVFVC